MISLICKKKSTIEAVRGGCGSVRGVQRKGNKDGWAERENYSGGNIARRLRGGILMLIERKKYQIMERLMKISLSYLQFYLTAVNHRYKKF